MEGSEDDLIVSLRIVVGTLEFCAHRTMPGAEAVPVNDFAE
jgi:hypothetical protein